MASPLRSKPILFGKYLLIEQLGRGGMAEVWKAKRVGPAGFVGLLVITRIHPIFARVPHFVEMFCHEAGLSARLNHANIVQVFELGDVDGEYYLAMEYVRGHNLASVVLAHKGLAPLGFAVHVVREMCRGLDYAHGLTDENGDPLRIIHRDVSPANVMLGFDGAVRLVDFGIAKALALADDNTTQGGALKGKFSYMSPEQADGKEVDHRADIFAVGVVLYEALTGTRLFRRATELQTIAAVREAKVDPPSKLNPEVPPELDRICLKALARDPDVRYQSSEAMGADLNPLVHQLHWGSQRLAGLLKDLFPAEENSPALEVMSQDGPDTPATQSTRTRWGRWVMAGCAVGLAGGIALVALRRHEGGESKPNPAAGLTASASGPTAPLAVSQPPVVVNPPPPGANVPPMAAQLPDVEVKLTTLLAGSEAEVFVSDETSPRGLTPLTLHFPRGAAPVKVVLKATGKPPVDVDVVPDENVRVEVVYAQAPAVVDNGAAVTAPPVLANPPVAVVAPATQPAPVGKRRHKTEFSYEELMEDENKATKPSPTEHDQASVPPPAPKPAPKPEPPPTSLPDKPAP